MEKPGYRSDIIRVIKLSKNQQWIDVFKFIENFQKEYGYFDALEYVDMNNYDTILHIACRNKTNISVIKQLLKLIPIDTENKYSETILHAACSKIYWNNKNDNSLILIQTLITEGTYSNKDIDCFSFLPHSTLSTPLSYVVNQTFKSQTFNENQVTIEVIKFLISLGADVNKYPKEWKSNYGYSSYLVAKINLLNNPNEYINNVIKLLENHGANMSYVKETYGKVVDMG